MNTYQFARTALTFGKENMEKLCKARVIVFGIGGVGSYVVEALVRSGIGAIDIVDDDKICLSNLNRQIYALHSTLGKDKVDVAQERILDINPDCKVTKWKTFYMPDTADQFDFSKYDYIVDCIDTVKGKLEIVTRAKEAKKPVISSMGAGNKVDPTKLKVADITRTSVCPLARVMRNELKKRRIKRLKVVFSTEPAIPPKTDEADAGFEDTSGVTPERKGSPKKQSPGSNAFVPSVAGMMIAAEVIKDLTQFHVTDLFRE
ncbi:MAG: tRNA threonylcarbamoyladenosine dehydratase [Treponema sp.]|nr:tRNA threonylcarbamoyladenosine dehydratase [Treponema sp.]